jgi:protein required for attachment to host cells
MPTPKVLFVLADGARARFVERSPETGHFVTVQELDSRHRLQSLRSELRASQPARTMEQHYPGGHAVNQQDFLRTAKEAFVAEVADRAAAMLEKRSYQGVFVAAPARLIATLREGLAGRAAITGELNRDLTKAPDSELDRWLPARPMSAA